MNTLKRFSTFIFASMLFMVGASAQKISVQDVELKSGKATVTVALDTEGKEFASMQTAIVMPDGLTKSKITLGDATTEDHGDYSSATYTNIAAAEALLKNGTLFTFVVTADDSFESGEISFTDIKFTNGATQDDFSVKVTVAANPWIDVLTSNVSWTLGDKATNETATISGVTYDVLKLGTSGAAGSATITVPAGTQNLYFHLAAWSTVADTKLIVTDAKGNELGTFVAVPAGVSGNAPYAITAANDATFMTLTFPEMLEETTTITVTSSHSTKSKQRVVIYGVNSDTEWASATLAVSAAQWATFCAPFEVDLSESHPEVSVYVVNGVQDNGVTLDLEDYEGYIPPFQPVVLYSETPLSLEVFGAEEEGSLDDAEGLLVGTFEQIAAPNGSYILQSQSGVVGFYQVDTTVASPKVGANRAYLNVAGAAVKSFFMNGGMETALDKVVAQKAAVTFDLQGRKVANAQKGVFVVNGKKVIK